MAPIHDRMPVILPATAWDAWLDPDNNDLVDLNGLLVPASDSLLTMHPVSTEVNKVSNKGPELIEPIDPSVPTPDASDHDGAGSRHARHLTVTRPDGPASDR